MRGAGVGRAVLGWDGAGTRSALAMVPLRRAQGKLKSPPGGGGAWSPCSRPPPPSGGGGSKGRRAMEPLFVYPPLSRADGAMDVRPF